jgi:hypothetical protein
MKYITVKPHGGWAGIGHQFTNWLVPNILAQRYGLKFVHQPFVGDTDGTYSQQGSNAFQITRPVKEWNDFLNFNEGQLTLQDLPDHVTLQLPYISQEEATWNHTLYKTVIDGDHAKFGYKKILYLVSEQSDGQFINIDWDFYKNNNLKIRYNHSEQVKNFKCYFDKDNINVAIAIRRGDVKKDQQFRRWMDLDYYLHIINALANIKELKHIIFHIYTWDMPEEEKNALLLHSIFGKTQGCTREIKLHIDEDVFSTFYHFTKADIFVSGQGAFSLMANYLADGIKLTTPFYMHWKNFPSDIEDLIPINNGIFDTDKLLLAIEKKNENP